MFAIVIFAMVALAGAEEDLADTLQEMRVEIKGLRQNLEATKSSLLMTKEFLKESNLLVHNLEEELRNVTEAVAENTKIAMDDEKNKSLSIKVGWPEIP